MSQSRCPRCRSSSRALPGLAPLGFASKVPAGVYRCRDAWHMPSLQTDAQEAVDIVAGLDSLVSGEPLLSAETLAFDPYREGTTGYPQ